MFSKRSQCPQHVKCLQSFGGQFSGGLQKVYYINTHTHRQRIFYLGGISRFYMMRKRNSTCYLGKINEKFKKSFYIVDLTHYLKKN